MPDLANSLEQSESPSIDTISTTPNNLNNSRMIEFHWQCNHQMIEGAVDSLFEEFQDYYLEQSGNLQGFRRQGNREMLKKFVLDLHACYKGDPTRWLAVPFNREFYYRSTRYHPRIGGQNIAKRVRDFLLDGRYIEVVMGFSDPRSGTGRRTRIRATQRLIDRIPTVSTGSYSLNKETIILKHPKEQGADTARLADYDDNDITNRMRDDLDIINDFISTHWIDLHVPDETFNEYNSQRIIEFSRKRLVRIFNNNSFEQGGRFYGAWWLQVPKELRPFIVIDGEETIELDFSSMHLAILYAEANIDLPSFDLYTVEGFERSVVKSAFTRLINVNSRDEAISTIRRKFPNMTVESVENLLDGFNELHSEVCASFYSGQGLRLQYMDSRIANLTLLRLRGLEIVALPIHDSFIVQRQHEEALRQAMTTSFNSIVEGSVNLGDLTERIDIPEVDSTDLYDHIVAYSQFNSRKFAEED